MTILDKAKDVFLSGKDAIEETKAYYNIGQWLEKNINDFDSSEIFSLLWNGELLPVKQQLLEISESLSELSNLSTTDVSSKLKKAGEIAKLQSHKTLLEGKFKKIKVEVGKKIFAKREEIYPIQDELGKLFEHLIFIQEEASKRERDSLDRKNKEAKDKEAKKTMEALQKKYKPKKILSYLILETGILVVNYFLFLLAWLLFLFLCLGLMLELCLEMEYSKGGFLYSYFICILLYALSKTVILIKF